MADLGLVHGASPLRATQRRPRRCRPGSRDRLCAGSLAVSPTYTNATVSASLTSPRQRTCREFHQLSRAARRVVKGRDSDAHRHR